MLGSELALAQNTRMDQALALIDGFVQAPDGADRSAASPAAPTGGR
jgi:hypothetical protein